MRRDAAAALGRIGGAPAVELLGTALQHQDGDVRRIAAVVLGQTGDARAVEALGAALKDESVFVRVAATEALGAIGDARAVEPLGAALKDQDWSVRQAAAVVLDKLGWQPDRSELGAIYWVAKKEWDKCVEIGTPTVKPLIAALKGTYDHNVRAAVARALGQIGDTQAVEPLGAALKNVITAAAWALDKLGWQPDRSELGAIYWIVKQQWDKCVEIGTPAVKPLGAVLQSSDWYMRRAAAETLVLHPT